MKDLSKQAVLASNVLHKAMAWYQANLDNDLIPGTPKWPEPHPDEVALHAACAELAGEG